VLKSTGDMLHFSHMILKQYIKTLYLF